MYCVAGTVKDLVEWFNLKAVEGVLCLFVPRNVEDEKLLGELFDSRGTLSARLGRDIAFCLFSSQASLETVKARETPSAPCLIVPGLVGTQHSQHHLPPENWQSIEPARARAEQLSIPVDQDLLRGLLRGCFVVGAFDEFAVLESSAGADQCHQVGCVDRAPA